MVGKYVQPWIQSFNVWCPSAVNKVIDEKKSLFTVLIKVLVLDTLYTINMLLASEHSKLNNCKLLF